MDALEIVELIRESVQIFALTPLRNGFPEDVITQPGTRILPWVNMAYRDLVKDGIYLCWHRLIMTPGQATYRLSGHFGLVHDLYLQNSGATQTYDLEVVDIPDQTGDPYFRSRGTQRRPGSCTFAGDMLVFNAKPDQAYRAYFFADTMPAPLILPTDIPTRLDVQNHDALVAGGSYYIGRHALARKDGVTQGHYLRYSELKAEWERRQKEVIGVSVSRYLHKASSPMVGDYRLRSHRR